MARGKSLPANEGAETIDTNLHAKGKAPAFPVLSDE